MSKKIIKRTLSSLIDQITNPLPSKFFIAPILNPIFLKIRKYQIKYYSPSEIKARAKHFGIKKMAILIDNQANAESLKDIQSIKIVGYYSFNLDIIGSTVNSFKVQPLLPGAKIRTDGWLVSAVNELTGFSLTQYLFVNKKEHQYILHHVRYPRGTKYYSYVDFITKDKQKTVIQINNYYRRLYNLPFPFPLLLTLRNSRGKIMSTKQIIIPTDGLRVVKSSDFAFKGLGYLDVEFEIAKTVVPFLHYMVDYISPNSITSNHQSGLGLHPAHSNFTRGYISTDPDKSLTVCLFQKDYVDPIKITAILEYYEDGEKKTISKPFPLLKQNQMLFQDVKKLFSNLDFSKIKSPLITCDSPVPLHRPNYYRTVKGRLGFTDAAHMGPDLKNYIKGTYRNSPTITSKEKSIFKEANVVSFDQKHFILPSKMKIDSYIAFGNDTTYPIKDFSLLLHNQEGKKIKTIKTTINYNNNRFFNLSQLLRSKKLTNFYGTISFRPQSQEQKVPVNLNAESIFISRRNPYITSSAGSAAAPNNIPFYYRGGPPSYIGKISAGITDVFARGISNNVFDTYYYITYPTANNKLKRKIKYEVQIINSEGEKKSIYQEIAPNGSNTLQLSKLIKQANHLSSEGYYTVWFFTSQAHLFGIHMLYRKEDHAIAAEHFYPGKFGA